MEKEIYKNKQKLTWGSWEAKRSVKVFTGCKPLCEPEACNIPVAFTPQTTGRGDLYAHIGSHGRVTSPNILCFLRCLIPALTERIVKL